MLLYALLLLCVLAQSDADSKLDSLERQLSANIPFKNIVMGERAESGFAGGAALAAGKRLSNSAQQLQRRVNEGGQSTTLELDRRRRMLDSSRERRMERVAHGNVRTNTAEGAGDMLAAMRSFREQQQQQQQQPQPELPQQQQQQQPQQNPIYQPQTHRSLLGSSIRVQSAQVSPHGRRRSPSSRSGRAGVRLWSMPYADGDNVPWATRAERDAMLARGGAHLPVNCSNIDEVTYDKSKYAAGTTILAYRGQFRGHEVIVKKPRSRTPSGHVITNEAAIERFKQEATMLLEFRHPHHVSFMGGCYENGRVLNVMQRLRPWSNEVKRADRWQWRDRMCAAKRLARLVKFWQRTKHGRYVHCDFFTHQFAFDDHFQAVMIDVDGLLRAPHGNGTRCMVHSDCRMKNCWKAELWPSRFGRVEEIEEIQCDERTHQCTGFDVGFNVYNFGKTLLQDLFMFDRVRWSDAPHGLREDIADVVDGCTHRRLRDRWDIDHVIDRLYEIYNKYATEKCPKYDD